MIALILSLALGATPVPRTIPQVQAPSDPTAPAADAGYVRTNNNGGIFQASENGSAYQSVLGKALRARDFGTKCDGTTDDGAALQSAFTAAFNQKRPLDLDGCTYLVKQELTNAGIEIRGSRGAAGTVIQAGASMTSVMHVTGVTRVLDVSVEAQGVATYSVKLDGTSYSRFHNVAADGAILDGWFLANGHGNDFVQLDNCIARQNGTIYASSGRAQSASGAHKVSLGGTRVNTTTGSQTISRQAGSTDFTTLGIRPGDFIGIGDNAVDSDWVQIVSTTSTTLTVNDIYQAATLQTRVAQPFAIFVGDGYHEEPSGDNNRNNIEHFYAANNAGVGLAFHGLYGPTIRTVQVDAPGAYPIEIGLYGGSPSGAPQGTQIDGLYSEGFDEIPQNGAIFASNCNSLLVTTTNVKTFPGGSVRLANPSVCYGFVMNDSALAGHLYPIGSVANDLPTTSLASPLGVGLLRWTGASCNAATPSVTVPTANAMLLWCSGAPGSNATMTGTPTFADGVDGQFVIAQATEATGTVTLQDESALSGSHLALKSPTVTLQPFDVIGLAFITGKWREMFRSNGGSSGTVALSGGTKAVTVRAGSSCTCSSTTANPVHCAVSSTTLTLTGTGTDSVSYTCQ